MTTPPVAAPSADPTVAVTGTPVDPVTGMGRALGLGNPAEVESSEAMIRREERLRVGIVRAPSERVRLLRRVVTETRMVPVQVRREVLEVEHSPIDAQHPHDLSTAGVDGKPLEIVLHEEVPVFTFEVRPVERVRVSIEEIAGDTVIREQLATEQVDVVNIPPPAPTV